MENSPTNHSLALLLRATHGLLAFLALLGSCCSLPPARITGGGFTTSHQPGGKILKSANHRWDCQKLGTFVLWMTSVPPGQPLYPAFLHLSLLSKTPFPPYTAFKLPHTPNSCLT